MFDSLGDKLGKVFGKLRGKGGLSEDDVAEAMREIRVALLEADVALPVVKQFVESVREKACSEKSPCEEGRCEKACSEESTGEEGNEEAGEEKGFLEKSCFTRRKENLRPEIFLEKERVTRGWKERRSKEELCSWTVGKQELCAPPALELSGDGR